MGRSPFFSSGPCPVVGVFLCVSAVFVAAHVACAARDVLCCVLCYIWHGVDPGHNFSEHSHDMSNFIGMLVMVTVQCSLLLFVHVHLEVRAVMCGGPVSAVLKHRGSTLGTPPHPKCGPGSAEDYVDCRPHVAISSRSLALGYHPSC